MASSQLLATMEKLPTDILSNISIRLFAKQLAQMRCVSKTWNHLLSRPSFIKSHLDRSLHKTDKILLVFYGQFSFRSNPFTAHPSQSPHLQLTNFIKLPKNLPSDSDYRSSDACGAVIGAVNGLICFKYGPFIDADCFIWNPSLSALLAVPPSDRPYLDYWNHVRIFFRFGYDPKTDDYKLVKLTKLVEGPKMPPPLPRDWWVEVYSMRKGVYQLITESPPSYITFWNNDRACVDGYDGHLHWFGYTEESVLNPLMILAFDLSAETFSEIVIPDLLLDKAIYHRLCLGVMEGKLCVMASSGRGTCEVWVMNEYRVADSWVKHHVFSQCPSFFAPLGFTLDNEFLFDAFYIDLTLYDPIAEKVKPFKIKSLSLGDTKILEYVDSLVWVARTKHKISWPCFSRFRF